MTAVALNSVPPHLAGMAGATTDMLRDLGFALGPVVVGAVALSGAGSAFTANLPGAGLTPGEAAVAGEAARAGGPIAVDGLPPGAPGSTAHGLALDALGSGFGTACPVCGVAAAAAAALTAFGMTGIRARRSSEDEASGVLPSAPDDRTPDPAVAR
ncbi:hypothetical protein GCM10010415_44370 [Streptomyces atrovirens]|uniref:MFS transporter n=1 Tax=Streptomyces atrovirens TaxID=285556 RepID=A0ABW0DP94_9ACTN